MNRSQNKIIVRLAGGLGNQLFQYAAARSFSIRLALPLYFDDSFYATQGSSTVAERQLNLTDLSIVKLTPLSAAEKAHLQIILTRHPSLRTITRLTSFMGLSSTPLVWNETLNRALGTWLPSNRTIILVGFWQDYTLFNDIRQILMREITPRQPAPDTVEDLMKEMNGDSVSVHIRRGDYLNSEIAERHGIIPLSYYDRAIRQIRERVPDCRLFFFSDDPEWVKETFEPRYGGRTIRYNEQIAEPYWDLHLMRQCYHHIVANSTFSWWGAYLRKCRNGFVYVPADWLSRKINRNNRLKLPDWTAI